MDFQIDKIYNEDCLEGMKRIADGAVDCIITDLPYGTTACAWDSVIPFEPLWEQFKRVTKPNAAIVLFGSEPFSSALRMSNIGMYKYDIYWHKHKPVNHINAKKQPMRSIETISVFYRQQPTFNLTKKDKPIKAVSTTTNTVFGKSENGYTRMVEINAKIDLVDYDKDHDNKHPTQKPVDLLRYLILTYSNEGDTILDATIGSGTTAVAALMEKRHFIGFETNKEYFDIAQGRIDQVLRNPTLF